MRAIAQHRADRVVLREMVGESETHTDGGGKLGAIAARPQQPDRRQCNVRRDGMHGAKRMILRKAAALQQEQLLKAFEKIVAFPHVLAAAERVGGHRIGPRCAAQPEIDAAGKQCLQHFEPFGDHERGMVHQHDPARADANPCRCRRDPSDHDLGRGAGDARQIMMLGEPIALVAEPVGKPRQIE